MNCCILYPHVYVVNVICRVPATYYYLLECVSVALRRGKTILELGASGVDTSKGWSAASDALRSGSAWTTTKTATARCRCLVGRTRLAPLVAGRSIRSGARRRVLWRVFRTVPLRTPNHWWRREFCDFNAAHALFPIRKPSR